MGQCQNHTSDMWANARITTLTCGSMPELHTYIPNTRANIRATPRTCGPMLNYTSNRGVNVTTVPRTRGTMSERLCQNFTMKMRAHVKTKHRISGSVSHWNITLRAEPGVLCVSVEDHYPVSWGSVSNLLRTSIQLVESHYPIAEDQYPIYWGAMLYQLRVRILSVDG